MSDADVAFAGAAAQAKLVRDGALSSRELTQLSLDRIATHDPVLNAFRLVFAERALTEADQADARRKAGDDRPLLGVPVAIKDDMDVKGEVTAKGSIAHGGPATEDAELVRRLRDDGAVIVGKTNVPELMTMAFTETVWYGATRNPWDLDRTPGGSSGGSAAAVAAGLVGAATASDGAGSIRIPAACTGLVGLKCGAGVIPTPLSWNGLSTFGFLSRRTADAALLNRIEPAPRRPLRITWSIKPPPGALVGPDEATTKAIDDMLAVLRDLGHTVTHQDPAWGAAGLRVVARYLRGIADDAAAFPHPERLDRRSRGLARLGRLAPGFDAALNAAEADRRKVEAQLDEVLLLPVVNTLPPRIGEYEGLGGVRSLDKAFRYTPFPGLLNHTGLPAIAVPTPGNDGFPRAVQFVGRTGSEPLLLALAVQLEEELGFADRIPPGF